MARVTLIEESDHPELSKLISRIRSGRRGNLLNVYKLLLHSPELTETWLDHLSAVRWKTQLSGRLRELVIIRIAYLNRVDYVINQHVPKLAGAEGITVEECKNLKDWHETSLFSDQERTTLAYTDAMTRDVTVPDEVFDALQLFFNNREIVELSVLIGTYNMHNRVVQALNLDLEKTD